RAGGHHRRLRARPRLRRHGQRHALLRDGDAHERRHRYAGCGIEGGAGMSSAEKLIFEIGAPGRRAATMTAMDVPTEALESMIPASMIRQEDALLPEVSEIEIVRHYTHLSQRNFGVDTGFYPLGSC